MNNFTLQAMQEKNRLIKKQRGRIAELEADLANNNEKFFTERDGKATVCLSYNDGEYPFNRMYLTVVDFSVSDNSYVVTSRTIDELFAKANKTARC